MFNICGFFPLGPLKLLFWFLKFCTIFFVFFVEDANIEKYNFTFKDQPLAVEYILFINNPYF
jgi:hypothetical protein